MSNQTQVIMFCVIGVLGTPLVVFVAIKTINKLMRPPVNTLIRSGDIELVDYVQPSQPLNTYYPRELLDSQFYPIYERFSAAPTYYSGVNKSLPSYHTVDSNIINCCLENENVINQIISWLIIFLLIRLVVLWFTHKKFYCFSSLIPFSLFDIDFRDSFEWKLKSYRDKPIISYLKIQSLTEDITKLLNSLNDNLNYSMSLSYISSYEKWKDNKEELHPLFVSNSIIINKESDPILITQFIMGRLNGKCFFISDWLFKDRLINSLDPVIITVIIPIIVKI